MRGDRFPLVEGHEAPVVVGLIDLESASGEDALDLSQANSFETRAFDLETEQVTTLPTTIRNATEGKLDVDARTLVEGEYAVQVRFNDTAGRLHIYPSAGDSFRFIVKDAY